MRRTRKVALLAIVQMVVAVGTASTRAHAEGESGETDLRAWASGEQPKPWMTPVEIIDAPKWDAGGFLLVPALHMPIFLTDPFGASNANASAQTAMGIGFQWRLGYSFGRFSLEPIGGFSHVSRDPVRLPNGKDQEMSLSRAWLGGQIRYTITTSRVSPFLGVGATADYWSSPLLFRQGQKGANVDGVWTPTGHAMLGAFVRLFAIGSLATVFAEAGVDGAYMLQGPVFDSDQIAISPFIGIDVMGARGGSVAQGGQHAAR